MQRDIHLLTMYFRLLRHTDRIDRDVWLKWLFEAELSAMHEYVEKIKRI